MCAAVPSLDGLEHDVLVPSGFDRLVAAYRVDVTNLQVVQALPSVYGQLLLTGSGSIRLAGPHITGPRLLTSGNACMLAPGQAAVWQGYMPQPGSADHATVYWLLFELGCGPIPMAPIDFGTAPARPGDPTRLAVREVLKCPSQVGVTLQLWQFPAAAPPPEGQFDGPGLVIARTDRVRITCGLEPDRLTDAAGACAVPPGRHVRVSGAHRQPAAYGPPSTPAFEAFVVTF